MQVATKRGTFYVNVCDSVADPALSGGGCGDAAVCLIDNAGSAVSYGLPSTQQFKMEGTSIKVAYKEGNTCGTFAIIWSYKYGNYSSVYIDIILHKRYFTWGGFSENLYHVHIIHPTGNGRAASYFLIECKEDMQGLGSPELFSVSSNWAKTHIPLRNNVK